MDILEQLLEEERLILAVQAAAVAFSEACKRGSFPPTFLPDELVGEVGDRACDVAYAMWDLGKTAARVAEAAAVAVDAEKALRAHTRKYKLWDRAPAA